MNNKHFLFGDISIGEGLKPLFLPDIGTFFNQDIEQAEQMIRVLAESGVKVVKGEILHTASIALDIDYDDEYLTEGQQVVQENYHQLIERKVVSLNDYTRLINLCHQLGMKVVVSVYDFEGVEFALQQGCVALKIASSNITHQPLISCVAKTGLPMIMDTGRSSLAEISRAVLWAKQAGAEKLIVQHSPKAPPVAVNEHNLRFMQTLKKTFGVQVGLSDHHAGNEMLLAATALGAVVLEKGVYMDGGVLDQGVYHSMPVSEVAQVSKQIGLVFQALGTGEATLKVVPHRARMGLVAKKNLGIGEGLSLENVSFAFPVLGIGAEHWEQVESCKLASPIKKGDVIHWEDIQHREF
ncbi:MAG: N-acetylneuraminate synthase family protein [Methyloprofundus sp.]|nr:N-acetylneuraminate synthase family protein [Methyloprofundus sp.]